MTASQTRGAQASRLTKKAATTRAHNRRWERKKYEIERQLRIGADKYGREQMIVFLKDRLAAMEKEMTQ